MPRPRGFHACGAFLSVLDLVSEATAEPSEWR